MITYRPLLEKDFKEVIKIAFVGLNLKRYCSSEEECNLFSKAYTYEYLANATYALGAYDKDICVGFILGDFKKEKKIFDCKYESLSKDCYNKLFVNKLPSKNGDIYSKACCELLSQANKKYDGELSLFAIDSEYKRHGIGKELLGQFLAYAKNNHYKLIYVMTDTDCNVNFYPKNGFCHISSKRIKFDYNELLELNCFLYDKDVS